MQSTSAEIYVFSGSGNTLLAADAVATILRDNNCPTKLLELAKGFSKPAEKAALGLAFPTAYCSTYPFILDFINNLPEDDGREVFLISTMSTIHLNMPEPIRKILVAKGYKPLAYCVLKMPSNYNKYASSHSLENESLIKEAVFQAGNFGGKLLTGKTSWLQTFAPWANYTYKFAQTTFPWRLFRKIFLLEINQQICIKCGLCQKICPTAAILKEKNNYNITAACVSCQHCAAFCPVKAINIKNAHTQPYQALTYDKMKEKFF